MTCAGANHPRQTRGGFRANACSRLASKDKVDWPSREGAWMQEGAITYDGLPIASGGAHRLRTRDIKSAADSLQSFVSAISADCVPSALQFELLSSPDASHGCLAELIAEQNACYGEARTQVVGKRRAHRWNVPTSAFEQIVAAAALISSEPQDDVLAPVTILAGWTLTLIDPASGQTLPHQDPLHYGGFGIGDGRFLGRSSLFARLATRTTANLWLSLPFRDATEDAQLIAGHVQAQFPCKLSAKHWKQWALTKRGTYTGRKIAPLC